MNADHKFYEEHGICDFPQKKIAAIIKMQLPSSLLTYLKIKAKMGNKMNEGMMAPHKKEIEKEKNHDFK